MMVLCDFLMMFGFMLLNLMMIVLFVGIFVVFGLLLGM